MNLEKEVYIKLVKDIKKDIVDNAKKGGYQQRIRLLSYGFLRGRPYRTIEAKINEDKFGSLGLSSFRISLFFDVESYFKKMGTEVERKEIEEWLKVPVVTEEKLIKELTSTHLIKELTSTHLENSSESMDGLYPAIKFKDEKYRVWPSKLEEQPLTQEEAEFVIKAMCDGK